MVTLAQVASVLGRPVEHLLELDRRSVRLAFLSGAYETVVVRDRTSGETLEVTLEASTGDRVEQDELRRRDRELAAAFGEALSPALRDLLVRHPELEAVRVAVTRSEDAPSTIRASAREIAALVRQPGVTRVELVEDPEIPDEFRDEG